MKIGTTVFCCRRCTGNKAIKRAANRSARRNAKHAAQVTAKEIA